MYDRKIGDRILDFNTSGALYHNALVMMDDQTDSYWAVISSDAIGGTLSGTDLKELPISEKTTWDTWLSKYPDTLLLSVDGKVHVDSNPYDNYFTNDKPFRPAVRADDRLPDKASIFTLVMGDKSYVVTHDEARGGWAGKTGERQVFVFREKSDSIYPSTIAWLLEKDGQPIKLRKRRGQWQSKELGKFDPSTGKFEESGVQLEKLLGLDTFWYIWSQYYPNTEIVAK